MDKQKIKQEVERYKSEADNIMKCFKEKYIDKGVGGRVELSFSFEEDRKIAEAILQEDITSDKYRVDFRRFFKYLFNVKRDELKDEDIINFLEEYFDKPLITKKERERKEKNEKEKYFNQLSNQVGDWFDKLLDNSYYKRQLTQYYGQVESEDLTNAINNVDKALKNLPSTEIKLGDFANQITQNPHFFDNQLKEGINRGLLLHYGLNIKLDLNISSADRKKLLNKANIYSNATSSIVFHAGFRGLKNNKLHQGWHGYLTEGDYICSTLEQIMELDTLQIATKEIYMFENPNVFSKVHETLDKDISLICGRGKLSQAVRLFLKKVINDNPKVKIYYSGDFDTVGLEIADSLKTAYPDNFILWQYNLDTYNSFEKSDLQIDKKDKEFKTNKLNRLYKKLNKKLFEESLVEKIINNI